MISIIIPTYREEKYIGRLLESVRKQKVKGKSGGIGIEVIVADRKSGDKTRKIAKKYGCKVVEGATVP